MSDDQAPIFHKEAPARVTRSIAARSANSPEPTSASATEAPAASSGDPVAAEPPSSAKEPSARLPAKKPRNPPVTKAPALRASRPTAQPEQLSATSAASHPDKGKGPAAPSLVPTFPASVTTQPLPISIDDADHDDSEQRPAVVLDYQALPPLPAYRNPFVPSLHAPASGSGYLPALAAAADHLPFGHQAGVAHQAQVAAYAFGAVPIDLDQPLVALSSPDSNVADSLSRRARYTTTGNLARTRERLRNAGAEFDQTILDLFIRLRYVDLGKIHPDRMYVTSGSTVTYVPEGDNLVPVKTDSAVVPIESLGPWLKAWKVYAWVNALLFPARYYELEGYRDHIQSLDGRYLWQDIYAYDQARRGYVSANPQVSLSIYMPDIKDRCLSMPLHVAARARGAHSQRGRQRHNPLAANPGADRQQATRFCYAFNGRNGCGTPAADCRFRHECLACHGGNHSRMDPTCPSRAAPRQRNQALNALHNGNAPNQQ